MATLPDPSSLNPTHSITSDDTSADSLIIKNSSDTSPASFDHQNSLQITIHKLNGQNFLQWSQSVKMYLRGRGRLGYLTGAIPTPDVADPSYAKWESENSLIMAWLINSMEIDIGKTYLFLSTAREVWDTVQEAFSDLENSAQVFELKSKLRDQRQNSLTVTQYYGILYNLWQEIDLFYVPAWKCPDDASSYQKMLDRERLFDFLHGLNRDLDEVRGRLLGKNPLPSIREAFAEVRREESRKRVMLGPPTVAAETDQSALTTQRSSNGNDSRGTRRDRPWCSHCSKLGHTKETCWRLHGKPADWKPRSSARAPSVSQALTAAPSEPFPFTPDQISQLHRLLNTSAAASTINPPSSTPPGTSTAFNAQHSAWIVDSGASDHMTGQSHQFTTYTPCPGTQKIKIADGSLSSVAGKGSIYLSSSITLYDVLHVPNLSCNLLSVSKITQDQQCFAVFSPLCCTFQDMSSGKTIGSAKACSGLYYIDPFPPAQVNKAFVSSCLVSRNDDIMRWHYRLGHPSFSYLKYLFPKLFRNKHLSLFKCEICQLAKHTRAIFHPVSYKSTQPFTLIHSDIWGPSRIINTTNTRWFITFIDDHTRVSWVFLLKQKSDAAMTFQNFHSMIKNQFNANLQVLHTDNGTEYFNSILGDYLLSNGIIHKSSCAGTPQQNGIAERKNRHLLEVARALMFTTSVPKHFWGEAILTAVYLINRMPSRVLKYHTPLSILLQAYPHTHLISNLPLKTFGCTSYVHILGPNRSKFDSRALRCVFLGYSSTKKGYKCYNPSTRRMYVSLDVTFNEEQSFYSTISLQGGTVSEVSSWDTWDTCLPKAIPEIDQTIHINTSSPPQSDLGNFEQQSQPKTKEFLVYSRRPKNHKVIQSTTAPASHESNSQTFPDVSDSSFNPILPDDIPNIEPSSMVEPESDLPIAKRKGIRSCTLHPISKYVCYSRLTPKYKAFLAEIEQVVVPKDITEALSQKEWKKAVYEEIGALEKNTTWTIVNRPIDKHVVGCKWVFTVKHKADGTIDRFKARLVAKGFTQTYGVDYNETFAPVAKLNTIRVLLSVATNLDWPLQQLDIKNAFLNGHLDEEVFMRIPPGFEERYGKENVCHLKKSLYGLKQSPRAWFERFNRVVKQYGYKQAQSDHTLFFKHSQEGKVSILIVYVDDMILTGDDYGEQEKLKSLLAKEFEVKHLGPMKYFLGMEVARTKQGITVSQRKYVLDLLKETGMSGCKPVATPVEPKGKYKPTKEKPVDKGMYQRLVGKLIYLSHTRPDIAFAVSLVSQYMHNPSEEHLDAVYRILRYLKKTPGNGLLFKKNEKRGVEAFTDADWAGSVEDRRSTTGYCTKVWGNLVTWRSKKQPVVARSSAEAELRALAQGVCELIWIKRILEELKLQRTEPLMLYSDSKSAINIAHNPIHHDRTKHVEVDRHFIKEKIDGKELCVVYIPSKQQQADLLTKGLSTESFNELVCKLGMWNLYSPA